MLSTLKPGRFASPVWTQNALLFYPMILLLPGGRACIRGWRIHGSGWPD